MVIGNGFFSDTKEDALKEMETRSGCKVVKSNFPTIGNIGYYISETGDLYGQQYIQGKYLTRQRKHQKYSPGYKARLSEAPHKEANIYVQVLVYCAFVLHRWEPDVELESVNGDVYDVRPQNLRPKQKPIPPEWSERMTTRKDVYKSNFMHVCWSVNYITSLPIEDCKDAVQSAFIYMCCEGYRAIQKCEDIVGLWVRLARFRAIDRLKHQNDRQVYDIIDWAAVTPAFHTELDLLSVLPGEKQRIYTQLYIDGNTPTEIAQMYGVKIGSVGSTVTRSLQYLRDYYKGENPL